MSLKIVALLLSIASVVSLALGYYLRLIISLGKKGSMELDLKQMELQAKEKEQKIIDDAEKKAEEMLRTARVEIREKADEIEAQKKEKLQKIAKLTPEEAREEIIKTVEKESEEDILVRMKKLETAGREALEEKSRSILATSIQRLSNSVTTDMLTTHVAIPSDEIKGKIIGKEGRNIKAFERCTGVEVIVDDTPGSITISSFDPVRRQVARIALEKLIADGRIQPAKIEEMVKTAEQEIDKTIKEKGEEAVYETGVLGLDPRVVSILGRLHFRTSYGQNVLAHSIEMAHIAGMIAEEIEANVQVAKAGALVHDIGKA